MLLWVKYLLCFSIRKKEFHEWMHQKSREKSIWETIQSLNMNFVYKSSSLKYRMKRVCGICVSFFSFNWMYVICYNNILYQPHEKTKQKEFFYIIFAECGLNSFAISKWFFFCLFVSYLCVVYTRRIFFFIQKTQSK